MEELVKKLDELFRQHFHGAVAELEQSKQFQKVGGLLSWDGFEGHEQIDRQHQVWDSIRAHLPQEEQRKVTVILTVTPDELAVMREQD